MPYSRSDTIPRKDVVQSFQELNNAVVKIKVWMREQHNKDVVLGMLDSEIRELKRLVNN